MTSVFFLFRDRPFLSLSRTIRPIISFHMRAENIAFQGTRQTQKSLTLNAGTPSTMARGAVEAEARG